MAFFVHTSLVLMLSLDRLPAHRQTLVFYIRRLFRIYPLSILCVVLVVSLRISADPMNNVAFQSPPLIVLMANIFLIQNLVGHWSVSAPLWSLPFEVQMYIVLPILHKLAQSRQAIRNLALLITAFSLLGWVVQWQTGHSNILAFVPCFLSGVLAYALRGRRPFLPPALWPFFLILWIVLGTWATDVSHGLFLLVRWASTILLGVSVYYFRESTEGAWNTATAWVAKYSYGIYLGHTPLLWVVFKLLPVYNIWVSILIWLAGTAAISVLAYHLLEEPMINVGRKVSTWFAPSARVVAPAPSRSAL